MSYRRFILLIVAAMWLLLPKNVSAVESDASHSSLESIDRTNNRPQWQDIGMCDVLAVTGGSTVTPPTTVRVIHDSPTGTTASSQTAQAWHYSPMRLAAHSCRPVVGSYIYLIRCLRL